MEYPAYTPEIGEKFQFIYWPKNTGINTYLTPGINGNTFSQPVPSTTTSYIASVESYEPLKVWLHPENEETGKYWDGDSFDGCFLNPIK